jgi:hypothetical protein
MIFVTMAFKLPIATTWVENQNFVMSLVWLFLYSKSSDCLSKIPPDGSELANFNIWCLSFDNEVDNLLQCKVNNFHLHRVRDQRSRWE